MSSARFLEASAGRMLRDPSHTIKETAAALGFADVAAFHHAFKGWTGMTPGEYRRSRYASQPIKTSATGS